jgi:hypothetical protein
MRIKERSTCDGVKPWRPVSEFFRPRARSRRTASTISSWSSRKSEMFCSSGSTTIALLQQLPIGETDLRLGRPGHLSALLLLLGSLVPLSFQSLNVARCSLVEQFLQSAPMIQAAAYFRYQFFGNINGKPSPLQASVQDVTGMLFTGQTSGAVRANAASAAQAEGAQQSGLQGFRLILKPAPDIGGRFR